MGSLFYILRETKKNQRPRIFLYTPCWSWDQAYSSLNSAKLSCSSGVTLCFHVYVNKKIPIHKFSHIHSEKHRKAWLVPACLSTSKQTMFVKYRAWGNIGSILDHKVSECFFSKTFSLLQKKYNSNLPMYKSRSYQRITKPSRILKK